MSNDIFKKHFAQSLLIEQKTLRAFLLTPKQGRVGAVLIVETTEGIVIMGDNAPGFHGTISAYGYSLAWFAGDLSADYLCSKFLEKKFQPRLVVQWIEGLEGVDAEDKANALDLFDSNPSEDQACEVLDDLGQNTSDLFTDGVFSGYDENDAGRLVAIQARFAELWGAA